MIRKIAKNCKKIAILVSVLIFAVSFTAIASELEENAGNNLKGDPYYVHLVGEEEGYTYTGESIRPEVEYVTYEGKSLPQELYEVSYSNDTQDSYIESGEHSVFVTVKDEQGAEITTLEKHFTIEKASLNDAEVVLEKSTYYYDGKKKTPEVTVTLDGKVVAEENYSVVYKNNIEVGNASVVISGIGNYTDSITVKYKVKLSSPVISTTPYYNKIKISWKQITGANGYAVYRSNTEDGEYTRIGTVKEPDTLSFVNADLTTGKTYYYKVHAYRRVDGTNKYSGASTIKKQQVQPAKTKITEITRKSATALEITWNKVSGATGYGIYRSTEKNGEYTRVGTAKGGATVAFVDKECICGRTYYYKISAYRKESGKNYYATKSAAKENNTVPARVTVSGDTKYSSTEITLKWEKVPYATGYRVYRSLDKSEGYEAIATIKDANTLSWKDTGLEKKVVYYYKVKAYCTIDGKNVWGVSSKAFEKSLAGWKYKKVDGVKLKLYYNAKGNLVKDVSNLIGKRDSYVIKVNKRKCTVTVYAKDGDNGYIIPVKSFVCSPGQSTPTGTYYTPIKYRWRELMGPCWGQWCTRIVDGFLFHSVYYNSYNNNNTLSVSAYNKLGTICSHGCVRLTAGDAKWIYDNCDLKTKVIIYNSDVAGPYGKPTAVKLAAGHTWDPTDPNMKDKCKSKGCH